MVWCSPGSPTKTTHRQPKTTHRFRKDAPPEQQEDEEEDFITILGELAFGEAAYHQGLLQEAGGVGWRVLDFNGFYSFFFFF